MRGVDSRGVSGLVMDSCGVCSPVMHSCGMRSLVMHSCGMRSLIMHSRRMRGLVIYTCGMLTGVSLNHGIRMPMIHREMLVPVIESLLLVRALRFRCFEMATLCSRRLSGGRSGFDSTRTIKAEMIDIRVVDHCTIHVGVVDDG
jgi:hypothetical protein